MTTPRIDTVQAWRGRSMVDPAGGTIGTLSDSYLDDDTAQPEWATVTTGLFGTRQSFVPLAEAEDLGDSVQVPYDRERVKNAPCMRAEGALSQDEEAALYRYYGLDYSVSRSASGPPAGAAEEDVGQRCDVRDTAVGGDLSGPTTDDATTRSEKELGVGTTQRERGRTRLRKYVTTE